MISFKKGFGFKIRTHTKKPYPNFKGKNCTLNLLNERIVGDFFFKLQCLGAADSKRPRPFRIGFF